MSTQTEALKLALEALELAKHSYGKMLLSDPPQDAWKTYRVDDALIKSITAIKEALAQPEQEPVAQKIWEEGAYGPEITELRDIPVGAFLYTTTPYVPTERQRPSRSDMTWVGLTDVEWMNIVNKDHAWFGQKPEDVAHEVAKAVEAKLKEKNT